MLNQMMNYLKNNSYLYNEDGTMTILLKMIICMGSLLAGAGTCYYCKIKRVFNKDGVTQKQVRPEQVKPEQVKPEIDENYYKRQSKAHQRAQARKAKESGDTLSV
jgi:hypothetical protein